MSIFHLRPYRAEDEDAAIALWQRTWQQAYPAIDFAARVPWWRERWRSELVPKAAIIVAEQAGALIGFVTIDASGYLDQLVVAPDHWGSELANALVDEAKRRLARSHHAAGQYRQYPRHPLLRTQRFCACRRGRESDLGTAGAEDGVEAVNVHGASSHSAVMLREADPVERPGTGSPAFAVDANDGKRHAVVGEAYTPSNCSRASLA